MFDARMKTRFPLYLKILLWFFGNMVFLGVVFLLVARVQFRFGLDSLIAGPAGEHLQDVTRLLTGNFRIDPVPNGTVCSRNMATSIT